MKYSSCSDGFCGASDCPKCSPHCFRGGVFVDEIERQEELKRADEIDRQWNAVMVFVKKRSENAGFKTPHETVGMVCEIMRMLAQPEDAQCDKYILELREAMGI
jgi:hypothetical protein